MHIHIQAYTTLKKITDCLIYCILSNGEVIKYHKFISVVDIDFSVRCLNPLVPKHDCTIRKQLYSTQILALESQIENRVLNLCIGQRFLRLACSIYATLLSFHDMIF